MVGIPTNTQDFADRKTKAVYLGGEGLSLSAMVAYQSARLLPSWENAAFRICVQVARVGAAASPGSVTSRLLERHVTERWCNESSRQINFDPQKAQSIILDRDATYWEINLLQYSMYIWLLCTILFMLDGISRWPLNI